MLTIVELKLKKKKSEEETFPVRQERGREAEIQEDTWNNKHRLV